MIHLNLSIGIDGVSFSTRMVQIGVLCETVCSKLKRLKELIKGKQFIKGLSEN